MTLTAKSQVINTALAHLGEEPIADITIDPQTPKLAKVLGQLDGPAGVEAWVLRRHPWLCALTYESLEPQPDLSNFKWKYVFLLPDTFARLWECSATGFLVGSLTISGADKHVIFANDAKLDVAYTQARDFEAYDADVCNVLAYELAARTAGPLQNAYDAAQRLTQKALAAIDMAQGGEAGQHASDDPLIFSDLEAQRRRGAF